MSTPEKHQPNHLAYLDGLRALAALAVLFCHEGWMHPWEASDGGSHFMPLIRLLGFGHYAVDVFIVLSGFCLMLPVTRKGHLAGGALFFFKKRARRILPPYYAALGLSLLLGLTALKRDAGTMWGASCVPITVPGLVAHLLLVQDAFASTIHNISTPLWSISVEWRIYFVFPLLVRLWHRAGGWQTTLLALAASVLLRSVLLHTPLNVDQTQDDGVCPQYLGLFALGMWGAYATFSPQPQMLVLRGRCPWTLFAALLLIGVVFVSAVPLHHGALLPIYVRDYLVGLFAMALLIAAGTQPRSGLPAFLSLRPLAWIGTFAYSLYLIHFPALALFEKIALHLHGFTRTGLFLTDMVFATPLIILASYAFHLVCERPFMTPRPRTERQAEVAAVVSPAP